MSFKQKYLNVLSAIQSTLQNCSSVKTVVLGERFKLGELPQAVVNVADMKISSSAMSRLQAVLNFQVIIIIRETEPENWVTNIVDIMADVLEQFYSDKTLGGSVDYIYPTFFSPGRITFENKLYYGGAVGFQAQFKI